MLMTRNNLLGPSITGLNEYSAVLVSDLSIQMGNVRYITAWPFSNLSSILQGSIFVPGDYSHYFYAYLVVSLGIS
jgi:hypothetical protein